jgi:hypothetical protein
MRTPPPEHPQQAAGALPPTYQRASYQQAGYGDEPAWMREEAGLAPTAGSSVHGETTPLRGAFFWLW